METAITALEGGLIEHQRFCPHNAIRGDWWDAEYLRTLQCIVALSEEYNRLYKNLEEMEKLTAQPQD